MQDSVGNGLLSGYHSHPESFDEMLAPDGGVRPHWQYLVDALGGLGLPALQERRSEAHRQLSESGVTYTVHGDLGARERTWLTTKAAVASRPIDRSRTMRSDSQP